MRKILSYKPKIIFILLNYLDKEVMNKVLCTITLRCVLFLRVK